MTMRPQLRAFLWVNLACLCWAGNLVVGRLLAQSIEPALLVAIRTSLAAGLLWLLVVISRSGKRAQDGTQRPAWGLLAVMAATGIVGYQGLLYQGLHTTGAFNAALINALCPLMTALMAWAVLGTRVSLRAWLGITASIAGVLVILSGGQTGRIASLAFQPGDLLILTAVLLWGVYSLAARRVMQRQTVIRATAAATTLAVPLSLGWVALDPGATAVQWSHGVVAGLAYVAIFASVVAMLSWNRAVSLAGPAHAAAAMNMMPVYALAVSVAVLGESLHLYQLVGGAIVIAGCLAGTLSTGGADLSRAGPAAPPGPAPDRPAR